MLLLDLKREKPGKQVVAVGFEEREKPGKQVVAVEFEERKKQVNERELTQNMYIIPDLH